jgi:hypothetical protein
MTDALDTSSCREKYAEALMASYRIVAFERWRKGPDSPVSVDVSEKQPGSHCAPGTNVPLLMRTKSYSSALVTIGVCTDR